MSNMFDVKIDGNDFPHLIDSRYEVPTVEATVHPFNNGKVAVIYPGANGSKDGYENKYLRMAEKLVAMGVCSVIRVPNTYHSGNGWTTGLEMAIEWVIKHAVEVCNKPKIEEIFLIGHSVGAGAISLVAVAYEQVTKVVLTSPAPLRRKNLAEHRINEFEGEVYVYIGEEDMVIPREEALDFYNFAVYSSNRILKLVPKCDHEWSGEECLAKFITLPSMLLA